MPTGQAPPSSTCRRGRTPAAHARRGGADAAEAVGAGRGHAGHAQRAPPRAAGPGPPGGRARAGRCWPARRRPPRPRRRGAARSPSAGRARRPHQAPAAAAGSGCETLRRSASATCTISGWSGRPALGRVDARPRPRRRRRGAQAVDRLGGKGHQLAGRQRWAAAANVGRVVAVAAGHRSWCSERRQAQPRRGLAGHARAWAGSARSPSGGPSCGRAGLGLAVQVQVHAGQGQHAPSRGRRAGWPSPPAPNHRSPSRLSITAAECRRGCTSGSPASVRTCRSNCETSQASML
jgi:hypothetical protein